MKKVFLATNNRGKIVRYQKYADLLDFQTIFETPTSLGIDAIDVIEDEDTLKGNAEKKARAYFGKVDMPILSNDTAFWVEGEGLVDAPKRVALKGLDENSLTDEEKARYLTDFWKGIASKYGGEVDAAWVEVFVLIDVDGEVHVSNSRREVILTDKEHGEPHIQLPVRGLYLSKQTGKPAIEHTEEEELEEMAPVINAIRELLG